MLPHAQGGYDPDIWFPEYEERGEGVSVAAKIAIAICEGECPISIRDDCLISALQRREQKGIWGGLTTKQREALLRRSRWPGQ